jgi:hypothetical protein
MSAPCRCWTATWFQHEGHCCFGPDSPEDCHDAEGARLTKRNGPRDIGAVLASRYWLTEKGWAATGGLPC